MLNLRDVAYKYDHYFSSVNLVSDAVNVSLDLKGGKTLSFTDLENKFTAYISMENFLSVNT